MLRVLRAEVESKFGRKIAYQKDCNALSGTIMEMQREYVSPATLRRVFGFLATNSNPSRVTLDILSRYAGFGDWEDFSRRNVKERPHAKSPSVDQWGIIRENARVISGNTVEHIRLKSGVDFDKTVRRRFATERLRGFINSDYSATAIIAPGGYGKSTLLALWYLRLLGKKRFTDDVVLFFSAQMLDQFAPTEVFIEVWLMRLLGLKPDSNLLFDLTEGSAKTPGRLIVVIDALDEITSQGARQEKILKALAGLAGRFAQSPLLKLVVSARLSAWHQLAAHVDDWAHWCFADSSLLTGDGANIPPLNMEEMQAVLDNTLNRRFETPTLVHEMHPDLRSIVAYPYFLQLFVQVYTPETKHLLSDKVAILSEFLSRQIYYSQHADEKLDILNLIIVRSEYGSAVVLKDDIKRVYPIHLKLSGNYYAAYEELNSYGIIAEEVLVDPFGGYIKYVKIANHQLMCMLIVQNLIRREQGISRALLKWVDTHLDEAEIQGIVLGMIFNMAYKKRLSEPLLGFFDLSDSALQAAFSTTAIASTLRADKVMRNELIPHYAKDKKARALLFEGCVDSDHLVTSYSRLAKEYLARSTTDAERLFANTMLAYIGLISANAPLAAAHYAEAREGNPRLLSPGNAGRWFACSLAYRYLFDATLSAETIERAVAFCQHYKVPGFMHDFAEAFIPVFLLVRQYEHIPQLIPLTDTLTASNHRAAVGFLLTKAYRVLFENRPLSTADSEVIEQAYSQFDPLNSYMPIIIGETLRSTHFLRSNSMEGTYSCIRNAVELSSIARYRLVEMLLMRNLSATLRQLGEPQCSAECANYLKDMWRQSGFKQALL